MRADQHPLAVWLRALWPVPLAAGRRELWLGGLGAVWWFGHTDAAMGERVRQAFADDIDIHAQVASQVYGVPLEQVVDRPRAHACLGHFQFDTIELVDFSECYLLRFFCSHQLPTQQ